MTDLISSIEDIATVAKPSYIENQRGRKKAVGEKPYQEHRSREDTETIIKNFLAEQGKPMTVNPIARAIGRTVSPHFRRILAGMVETGQIIESTDTVPNGMMVRYWYSLPNRSQTQK